MMGDHFADLFERRSACGQQDQSRAVQEASPDLEGGRIEGEGREVQKDFAGVEVRVVRAAD